MPLSEKLKKIVKISEILHEKISLKKDRRRYLQPHKHLLVFMTLDCLQYNESSEIESVLEIGSFCVNPGQTNGRTYMQTTFA